MGKIWLLTAASLRKNKGQTVSYFFLILLAAALLNLGLIVSFRYPENFDRRAAQSNSADVITILQNGDGNDTKTYEKELEADGRTGKLEVRPVLFFTGSSNYADSETTRKYAVMKESTRPQIGTITYVEREEETVGHPIYLPWLYKMGGGYALGDTFTLRITTAEGEEKSFHYEVAGFFDETLLATINSTTTGLILGDEEYRTLSEACSGTLEGSMFLVRLKTPSQNEAYSTAHLPVPSGEGILADSVFYDAVKRSRTLTSSIGSMLIVAFSMMIAGVMLIVVKFRIGNNIEEEMPNIGMQKAIGYTSRQILSSVLLLFVSTGSCGIAAGIGSSYFLLPVVGRMFAAQTGVVWNPGFDLLSASLTFLFLFTAVTIVSLLSAGKIKVLTPIAAIRTGIATHSFKRNYFPLEKSRGNVIVLLAGKLLMIHGRPNILIGLIIALISFTSLFSGVLYYNIAMKFDDFMGSTVGELSDIQIACSGSGTAEELLWEVKGMPEVKKAFTSFTDSVQSQEGAQIVCYAVENYGLYDNQNMIYEGRFPKHWNEVAIGGLLAGKLSKKPGDTILLTRDGNQAEYLITGLVQGSNYMGHDAALTEEGYLRLAPDYKPTTLMVYLREGEDTAQFLKKLEGRKDGILAFDYKKVIRASLGAYQGIVTALAAVIACVTAVIVALTLYLVVKTAILRRRRELGIQKAIGYTTGQLMLMTAAGFFPVVMTGAVLGNAAGYFLVNPLISLLFSGIGIMKVDYEIPMLLLIGLSAGITLSGFLVSLIVAARIRNITPCSLMTE